MLAAALGLGEALGARFRVLGMLPAGLLALYVLALLQSGAPADAPSLDRIADAAEALTAWQGVALVLAVIAFALVTEPLQVALVRLLEGYWAPERVAAPLVGLQARRRANEQRVETAAEDSVGEERRRLAGWRLRHLYPPEGARPLPTRLGNVLRVAEDRAGRRYGLDAVVAWPRLYPLLPERLVAILDDQRTQIDVAARFCAAFALAALVSAALLATHGWWLAVALVPLALSALSYSATVAAAVAYGVTLETAFDLHRFELLAALHLPLPASRTAERAANRELSRFLRQGVPVDFAYEHPEPADDGGSRAS